MKTHILKLYGAAVLLFLFLAIHGIWNLRVTETRSVPQAGYTFLTDVMTSTIEDDSAPIGERIILVLRVSGVERDCNVLAFYTMHQNVKVYLGDRCIYSLEAVPGLFQPKSPGRVYNRVELDEEMNGRGLRIELTPIYKTGSSDIPELLFGSRYAVVQYLLQANFFSIVLCAVSILTGLLMLLLTVRRSKEDGGSDKKMLLFLEFFSVGIGIWKLFDCSLIGLAGARFPGISVVPFFALTLLPVIVVEFVRSVITEKKSLVWDIPGWVCLFAIVVTFALQVSGIADIWETLWLIQICLVISGVCMVIGVVQIVKKYGWKRNVKMGFACTCCCLVWLVVDMMTYYGEQGIEKFPLGLLVYMIFLTFMVVDRLRQSKERMEEGMHARQYKKLAYHDAYTDHIASEEFSPQKSVMVAFDLNSLKKCNDELGHEKGDTYIKESAKIIMDCFGEKGRCYRLGGDEFGAILSGVTLEDCGRYVEHMKEKVKKFNENSGDIHMGIACGYAAFDPKEDEDINATIRRADKMMYEEKFRMKQAEE